MLIDLTVADLDVGPSILDTLRRLLDREEDERAGRFVHPVHAARFVAAHAALRIALGQALGCPPSGVPLERLPCNRCGGPHGKPHLAGSVLRFNLTHSGDRAAIAVSAEREVGVDIEHVRADLWSDEMAERFLHPEEQALLRAVPARWRPAAFLRCWTRKEAVVKATGEGLGRSFDTFSVLGLDELVRLAHGPVLSVRSVDVGPAYVGAIAVDAGGGGDVALRTRTLDLRTWTGRRAVAGAAAQLGRHRWGRQAYLGKWSSCTNRLR